MVYSPHQWGIGNKGGGSLGGGFGTGMGGSSGSSGFMPKMLGSMLGGSGGGSFGGGGSSGAAAKPVLMSGGAPAMALSGGGGSDSTDTADTTTDEEKVSFDPSLESAFSMSYKKIGDIQKQMDTFYTNYQNLLKGNPIRAQHNLEQYKLKQSEYQKAMGGLFDAWLPLYKNYGASGTDIPGWLYPIISQYGLPTG